MAKWIYKFSEGSAQGSAKDYDLLGGKGANLAEMCNMGLPVPPGFTITTEVCTFYYQNNHSYPEQLVQEVKMALQHIEQKSGKIFGSEQNPLLLSVRSGARVSMPGMMDTVLNLGLNDATVKTLADLTNTKFAYDSYRRFIQMYGSVVLGLDHSKFEEILDNYKLKYDYDLDTQLDGQDWQNIIASYKEYAHKALGKEFPQNSEEQLWGAIGAVFDSWMTPRAIVYRKLHNISADCGTAVNVQAMVFGNMGEDCATGVGFTRNPSTGEQELYGEFLVNAQGEDVVAGIRTPQNITEKARIDSGLDAMSLEKLMPQAFNKFCNVAQSLEKHYGDMQDLEFTIERGKLWMLQTRSGKRTAKAAIKIAVDMYHEGLITKEEALLRLEAKSLDQLLHACIDPKAQKQVIAIGLQASPGAAVGEVVFSSDEAQHAHSEGKQVILVRIETSPEESHGMIAAPGIFTSRGGMTSHAAVVARGMGKPCVCGATNLKIDYAKATMQVGDIVLKKGDIITIDGSTGEIIKGHVAMLEPELSAEFKQIMNWADATRNLQIRANAETPLDTKIAVNFGAEGIGLCRTEHMFFAQDRINVVREMILANNERDRRQALAKLLPMQKADFCQLFNILKGLPLNIRLLDPPLHEFLPKTKEELVEIAAIINVLPEALEARAEALHEFNPMLGLRGCRLAITYPEIVECQARAIFEAACETYKNTNIAVNLEIMVPLIATKAELDFVKKYIDEVAQLVFKEQNMELDYLVGTMIELPRACLCADEIAHTAQFFSFGTNDLTQTTFGISRDDAAPFLSTYLDKHLLSADPFVSLDSVGVGKLMSIATEYGRKTRSDIKLGVCGEHGGDPDSIMFFEKIGLNYISCSPYRLPIARLAAAQAAIKLQQHDQFAKNIAT